MDQMGKEGSTHSKLTCHIVIDIEYIKEMGYWKSRYIYRLSCARHSLAEGWRLPLASSADMSFLLCTADTANFGFRLSTLVRGGDGREDYHRHDAELVLGNIHMTTT